MGIARDANHAPGRVGHKRYAGALVKTRFRTQQTRSLYASVRSSVPDDEQAPADGEVRVVRSYTADSQSIEPGQRARPTTKRRNEPAADRAAYIRDSKLRAKYAADVLVKPIAVCLCTAG